MSNATNTADENTVTYRAEETTYGWCVVDSCNQRWWPHDDADEEIAASPDPAATVMAICEREPMRGEWAN